MSRGLPNTNIISDEDLTELLASTEGTAPEEIERGAAKLEIAPPERAIIIDIAKAELPDHEDRDDKIDDQ